MKALIKRVLKIIFSQQGQETIRYIIIGVLTTAISFGSYYILYDKIGTEPNVSNIISILLAVLFAYIMNKIYVFRSQTTGYKELFNEFSRFVGSRALTMVFEVVGVFVLLSIIGLHELVSKALISIGVLIGNYVLAKIYVFRKKYQKSI